MAAKPSPATVSNGAGLCVGQRQGALQSLWTAAVDPRFGSWCRTRNTAPRARSDLRGERFLWPGGPGTARMHRNSCGGYEFGAALIGCRRPGHVRTPVTLGFHWDAPRAMGRISIGALSMPGRDLPGRRASLPRYSLPSAGVEPAPPVDQCPEHRSSGFRASVPGWVQ